MPSPSPPLSSEQQQEEEEDWLEASDWDDPLEIALLYKSTDATVAAADDNNTTSTSTSTSTSTCGHAVRWIPSKLVDLKECPICQAPVQLICDGGVSLTTTSNIPCITVKYGKQTYRLSLAAPKKVEPTPKSFLESIQLRLQLQLLAWSANANPSARPISTSTSTSTSSITAQDRMQQALGLVGGAFKILHKGKVLYPPNTTTTTKASSSSSASPDELSQRLVDISEADWQAPHRRASLVLMGTLQGRELPAPPETKNPTRTSWTSSSTWQQVAFLPFHMLRWSLHGTWVFVWSFLAPFLPRSLTTTTMTDEDRPHQH
jgi:hypothetical protein